MQACGHANMSEATMKSLKEARQKGLAIVVGSRVGAGLVTPTGQFQQAGFVTAMMQCAKGRDTADARSDENPG
jgi:L-asparaginase/Glu-tRNA(Gln) amidotransferase subunit D